MNTSRIFFITGVSSGFGRAIATAALSAGHQVVGTVRDESASEAFGKLKPGRAHARLLDITQFDRIDSVVAEVEDSIGPIDVLLNNAGYGHEGIMEESPLEAMRKQFDVNVFGAVALKKRTQRPAGMSDAQVPDIQARDFSAMAPDQKWATDVTEFNVAGQKIYLSACMDLYNGEIIAHRMARRPVFELVSDTMHAALSHCKPTSELTVHSDQGWHYKMQPYRAMLARRGVQQSMSRRGNCFDNAVIESFFGTLKTEYFHFAAPSCIDALQAGVHDYIHYYNHERIKLGLQGLSPVEYRRRLPGGTVTVQLLGVSSIPG